MLRGMVKFITGVLVGVLALFIYMQTSPQSAGPVMQITTPPPPADDLTAVLDSRLEALSDQLTTYMDITYQLEQSLIDTNTRLAALEQAQQEFVINDTRATEKIPVSAPVEPAPAIENSSDQDQPLSIATLVDVGIDPQQAADILRRQAVLDLRRLELRDQAIRDGTLGSKSYQDALRQLNVNTAAMREELGDDTYDRYLYATGQNNRVVVRSVIAGSAAEQAGIRQGDMILGYADSRIFTWPELRTATTEGYRGEYVTVNIQRENKTLSLLLPRGPLGVRLTTSSSPPPINQGY